MAKFHTLKVSDVHRETKDAVSVAFEVPENLASEYKYIQGQYLTFKLMMDGEEVRRSYSICTSPVADSDLRIAVKEVEGGKMSPYLNKTVKAGDEIEVMTPMGRFFTEVSENNSKNYVLFAGGSGITPIFGIIKTILKVEPKSQIKLVYANRNEFSVIFKDQLEKLADENQNFKLILTYDQAPAHFDDLHAGVLNKSKVLELVEAYKVQSTADEIFVCGPTPMMNNITETLSNLGVDKKKVHVEYFTTVLEDIAKEENKAPQVESDFSGKSSIKVILDGEEAEFELSSDGDSILDAAIDAGLDVPFSCKGAVCCTCRAKVMEGKVEMDMNYALEEDEIEEGFVLTCQSHPRSANVVVDFDQM
jgi:ring-1,2-phenylacetyl-CoA epoxidase subunit PaaE